MASTIYGIGAGASDISTSLTSFGASAANANTSGTNNIAIGVNALVANNTGSSNVAIGYNAMNTNTTGTTNTVVGYDADVGSNNISNAMALGNGAIVDASNKIRLGNSSITHLECAAGLSLPSDTRLKREIKEDIPGLAFINKLRPVSYIKNNEEKPRRHTGFIAQEVEEAAKKINFDFCAVNRPKNDDGYYSLVYQTFVVPLVKAVQEQQRQIEELKELLNK